MLVPLRNNCQGCKAYRLLPSGLFLNNRWKRKQQLPLPKVSLFQKAYYATGIRNKPHYKAELHLCISFPSSRNPLLKKSFLKLLFKPLSAHRFLVCTQVSCPKKLSQHLYVNTVTNRTPKNEYCCSVRGLKWLDSHFLNRSTPLAKDKLYFHHCLFVTYNHRIQHRHIRTLPLPLDGPSLSLLKMRNTDDTVGNILFLSTMRKWEWQGILA